MNNDSLDRLEMTMRRCDNNMKEIYETTLTIGK